MAGGAPGAGNRAEQDDTGHWVVKGDNAREGGRHQEADGESITGPSDVARLHLDEQSEPCQQPHDRIPAKTRPLDPKLPHSYDHRHT